MVGITRHQYFENDSTFKTSANARSSLPVAVTANTNSDEVDSNDYRFEVARLQSFQNWPISYIEPEKLAAAGFYYTGEGDKVKCFECRVEICKWVEGDSPMVDHRRWSGTCRFIRKINCGNVPIGVDANTVTPPSGRDECSPYGLIYRPTSAPDNHNFSRELQPPSTVKPSCLSLADTGKKPVHPEYATYEDRLHTFATWPSSVPVSKEKLADAGFYHVGKNDQTLCYHCGVGLRDWEAGQCPWEEHAKWYPKCCYLLMIRGQDYINRVTGQI